MSSRPLVSVIIPVFQRCDYLYAALGGVQAQRYDNLEVIVVDDGSGDDWVGRYRLPSGVALRRLSQNRGPGAARNAGFAAARGDLVAWLDSDDVWLPGYLAAQVSQLEAHPDAGLAYCHATMVDDQLRPLSEQLEPVPVTGNPLPLIARSNAVRSPSCVVARRSVLEQSGGFDEALKGAEDWDLWIAMARFAPFAFDPTPRVLYRVHHDQRSTFGLHRLEVDEAIRVKWLAWAERESPLLTPVMRKALCRDLQRHSSLYLEHGHDLPRALRTLAWAIRTYPRDVRSYSRLFRVLALSLSIAGRRQPAG
jgi:glycosyltransferase involved in cell wall biosynthesis